MITSRFTLEKNKKFYGLKARQMPIVDALERLRQEFKVTLGFTANLKADLFSKLQNKKVTTVFQLDTKK